MLDFRLVFDENESWLLAKQVNSENKPSIVNRKILALPHIEEFWLVICKVAPENGSQVTSQ